MEYLTVHFSHIFCLCQDFQVVYQIKELFVVWVIVPGDYWDSVVEMVTETVGCVVYYYYVLQTTVVEDS